MEKLTKVLTAFVLIIGFYIISGIKGETVLASEKIFYDSSNAQSITVINYHAFFDEKAYPQIENVNISGEKFREQLQAFKDEGYTTITEAQLVSYLKGNGRIPKKSIMLTIDDGYESVYTVAYPILKELGMTATLFPITSEIVDGERKGAPMLTWEQISEIAKSGVMTLGNHSHDLHWRGNNDSRGYEAMILKEKKDGTPLATDTERKEYIQEDIKKAEQLIYEHTGVRTTSISYPYGAYDKLAIQSIQELGYDVGYTTTYGYNLFGGGYFEIKRIASNGTVSATSLVKKVKSYTEASMNYLDAKQDLQISKELTNTNIKVGAWSKKDRLNYTLSTKGYRFELYRTINGQRTYVGQASRLNIVPTAYDSTETLTELFSTYNPKGLYSMKIIMTKNDGSQQIAWINYTVK